ncbi:MAG: transglycosylase SLT domain-containing protein [Anaerolineales bacterium]|nr:transglycosylase SLT domain-containing protein [Anaerolineales bacterium]
MSRTWPIFLIFLLVLAGIPSTRVSVRAASSQATRPLTVSMTAVKIPPSAPLLSPYWSEDITRWSNQIYKVAYVYGIDPDLIAAVVYAESRGQADVESYVGAVGLMGVMPYGPGLEWRPTSRELQDPETNLRWGVSILADILRQSGGDVFAALAAYNGGWRQANREYTQAYATAVLNEYAQAVVVRSGQEPNTAVAWTIAIEKSRGHVPQERYLVVGAQPANPSSLIGGHVVYQAVDRRGTAYYVKGYAVPLKTDVVSHVPETETPTGTEPETTAVFAPPTKDDAVSPDKNRSRAPRVLLACLPSLERLRGQVGSRWFAPSACPSQTRD